MIVARIKAQMSSIRDDEMLKARALKCLIDWLTRKVEKSVIDCKEIDFEVFVLCLRFCACDERDLSLIEVQTRSISKRFDLINRVEVVNFDVKNSYLRVLSFRWVFKFAISSIAIWETFDFLLSKALLWCYLKEWYQNELISIWKRFVMFQESRSQ